MAASCETCGAGRAEHHPSMERVLEVIFEVLQVVGGLSEQGRGLIWLMWTIQGNQWAETLLGC